MATEMIKGAEYTFGGERFTFISVFASDPAWGQFRHTSGHDYDLRLCDVEPVVEPTPFPEPERWESSGRVVLTPNRRWAENMFESTTIKDDHNDTVDRLMREIRRLEALVNKK